MGIQPDGDKIRNAVKWVGGEKKAHPEKSMRELVEQAGVTFDLSPAEAEFLSRQLCESTTP